MSGHIGFCRYISALQKISKKNWKNLLVTYMHGYNRLDAYLMIIVDNFFLFLSSHNAIPPRNS